jgi:hypothetical protein
MPDDRLELRYVPLDQATLWDRNPKKHDIGALVQSIERYGFKDPPKFEPKLKALAEGNGRSEALRILRDNGSPPPRGIAVSEDGEWLVPVLFGVDAVSRAEAEAYGVDHNQLTLAGGDFGPADAVRLWDEESFKGILLDLKDLDELPVSWGPDDAGMLLEPAFDPVAPEEQSRLDEKKLVTCPECGKEFKP